MDDKHVPSSKEDSGTEEKQCNRINNPRFAWDNFASVNSN